MMAIKLLVLVCVIVFYFSCKANAQVSPAGAWCCAHRSGPVPPGMEDPLQCASDGNSPEAFEGSSQCCVRCFQCYCGMPARIPEDKTTDGCVHCFYNNTDPMVWPPYYLDPNGTPDQNIPGVYVTECLSTGFQLHACNRVCNSFSRPPDCEIWDNDQLVFPMGRPCPSTRVTVPAPGSMMSGNPDDFKYQCLTITNTRGKPRDDKTINVDDEWNRQKCKDCYSNDALTLLGKCPPLLAPTDKPKCNKTKPVYTTMQSSPTISGSSSSGSGSGSTSSMTGSYPVTSTTGSYSSGSGSGSGSGWYYIGGAFAIVLGGAATGVVGYKVHKVTKSRRKTLMLGKARAMQQQQLEDVQLQVRDVPTPQTGSIQQ